MRPSINNIADAVPHPADLAGKRLQPERGQPGRRARRRAVHAGDRCRSMRLDDPFNPLAGGARFGARCCASLIQQFGNARPRRRGLQCRAQARAGLARQERQAAARNARLRAAHHRRRRRALEDASRRAGSRSRARRAPCQREAGLFAANGPEKIPLPPVAHQGGACKAVAAVAALSQRRKGTKSAPADASQARRHGRQDSGRRLPRATQRRPTKLAKSKAQGRQAESSVQQALPPQGRKAAPSKLAGKAGTKTVSARSKTEKAKGRRGTSPRGK